MKDLTINDISEGEFSALQRITAANGRCVEEQVRHLIKCRVDADDETGFGSKLAAKYCGVVDQDFYVGIGHPARLPPRDK